jgi:hypothetical protein
MTIYCLCFYGRHGDRFAVHRISLPDDTHAAGGLAAPTQRDDATCESAGGKGIPRRQLPANEA